jgi:hypothetical protein
MLPPIRNESHRTSSSRSGRVRRLLDTRHPLGVEGVPAPGVTGGGGSVRPTFGGNAVWFASSSGQTLSKLDPETVARPLAEVDSGVCWFALRDLSVA